MIRVLLDTTVLIDLSREPELVLPTLRISVLVAGTIGVCAVSVGEFFAGVPVLERPRWERWIADFEYWDISCEAATMAGHFRYDLARRGFALHIADALIAATAITMDATLLTNNVKDFPMPGIRLMRLGA